MIHDDKCELADPNRPAYMGASCRCGSRAYPLCAGCRDARHTQHQPTNPTTGKTCRCDLCEEAA